MTEANRDSNSGVLENDPFRGHRHILTKEDRIKGGSQKSSKKTLANSFKNMSSGRFTDHVPHCHTCIFRDKCQMYDHKNPTAACKVIDIPNYMHLMSALTFTSEEDFDNFVNKQMQQMFIKNLTDDDKKKKYDFMSLMLRVKEAKYRSPREQTINLQINNFTSEFQIFKDVTLKVLNKHPEVMQEWRAAIESAKQSN